MVQSGKQLELTVACGLAKGDTVHVLGRIQGGSEFLAWMDDLVHAGEDDLVDWDDEKDVIKWMMEGRREKREERGEKREERREKRKERREKREDDDRSRRQQQHTSNKHKFSSAQL